MRSFLALAALVLLVAPGCGDKTTSNGADMSVATFDLSVLPDDLGRFGTCAGILGCVQGCALDTACQSTCLANGTTAAKAAFQPLLTCVAETCGKGDGGNGSCTGMLDTAQTCVQCTSDVAAAAQLGTNFPCGTEFANCAAN